MDTLNFAFRLFGHVEDDLKKDEEYILLVNNSKCLITFGLLFEF